MFREFSGVGELSSAFSIMVMRPPSGDSCWFDSSVIGSELNWRCWFESNFVELNSSTLN